MNKKLSMFEIALRLTTICVISVFFLAIVNLFTSGKIKENNRLQEEIANKFLLPEATKFSEKLFFSSVSEKEKNSYYFFKAYDISDTIIGYIVYTQGVGFGGNMKIAFSTDPNLKILKVKLLDNSETPGYGKKYEKEKNIKLFYNTNTPEKRIPDNLGALSPEEKDVVTSATISFNGIAGGLKTGIKLLEKEIR